MRLGKIVCGIVSRKNDSHIT